MCAKDFLRSMSCTRPSAVLYTKSVVAGYLPTSDKTPKTRLPSCEKPSKRRDMIRSYSASDVRRLTTTAARAPAGRKRSWYSALQSWEFVPWSSAVETLSTAVSPARPLQMRVKHLHLFGGECLLRQFSAEVLLLLGYELLVATSIDKGVRTSVFHERIFFF